MEAARRFEFREESGPSLFLLQERAKGAPAGQKAAHGARAHLSNATFAQMCQPVEGRQQPRERILLHLHELQEKEGEEHDLLADYEMAKQDFMCPVDLR